MSVGMGNTNKTKSPGVRRFDRLCRKILDQDKRMNGEKPTEEHVREKENLIELWREYGGRFSVFAPEQQPVPEIWEPQITEKDQKGRTNPQYLMHWKFLERTKEFIRDRNSTYKVLQGRLCTSIALSPNSRIACSIDGRWINMETSYPMR